MNFSPFIRYPNFLSLKKLLIVIFIIGLFSQIRAQEQRIPLLKGTIINEKAQPISFAHVKVKKSLKGTISNIQGKFTLNVEPLDAVQISCLGYKTKTFFIPIEIPGEFNYKFILRRDTITLAETIITPWPGTYQKLKEEIKKIELRDTLVFEPKNRFIIDLKTKAEYASLGSEGTPAMVSPGPFSILHNAFGDKPKQLRKLKSDKVTETQNDIINEKFNSDIIRKITGLTHKKQIDEFIDFCSFDNIFLLEKSSYDIAIEIKKKHIEFQRNRTE